MYDCIVHDYIIYNCFVYYCIVYNCIVYDCIVGIFYGSVLTWGQLMELWVAWKQLCESLNIKKWKKIEDGYTYFERYLKGVDGSYQKKGIFEDVSILRHILLWKVFWEVMMDHKVIISTTWDLGLETSILFACKRLKWWFLKCSSSLKMLITHSPKSVSGCF